VARGPEVVQDCGQHRLGTRLIEDLDRIVRSCRHRVVWLGFGV
jgi:hypothetical protein